MATVKHPWASPRRINPLTQHLAPELTVCCAPMNAKITSRACEINQQLALAVAEKVAAWSGTHGHSAGGGETLRSALPAIPNIPLSRFCACSACQVPSLATIDSLSAARKKLKQMCSKNMRDFEDRNWFASQTDLPEHGSSVSLRGGRIDRAERM